ncbi:hypothetical protein TRAPUB_9569 [Trametes pubescens]|uniref:Uncharacterized protein n=1 Tax=Trametes pubescens TaxID=154538 RepID=A0A1M2W2A0_TRAPU|nr:hypothetical protein TRAPUB_9569 [Trametes pubescens]
MAAPTQVLPSWLTLSTSLVTLTDGSVLTSSKLLTLPLTYYGPSIPLGTDGVWTYGGLTSPVSTSTSPSATATPTPSSSLITSALTTTPSASTSLSSTPTTPLSASTASASSTSSAPAASSSAAIAGGASHGISPATLGAILGSVLGTLLLLVLIAIIFLLRQNRRRHDTAPNGHPSSSFWNRQTTLLSLLSRSGPRQTPIWTGWEVVDPDEGPEGGRRSPGEGSPRGSGEEEDPFLTRRSARSGGTDMAQTRTDTDTLVSLPAAVRTGSVSAHHSVRKPSGHIISPEEQLRLEEQFADAPPYASIRVVAPSTSSEQEAPLIPPPPLNYDNRGSASHRVSVHPSLRSQKSREARSLTSEKSLGSIGTDPQEEGAELLTARRVKVSRINPPADAGAGSSSMAPPSTLALDRLANLGRLSWFKRMSFLGTPTGSRPLSYADPDTAAAATSDPYTRTPPRHSRNGSQSGTGSRSRPGSFARASPLEPAAADSLGRRLRQDSGLGFGMTDERPISTVSARSATSGNTVFYDAQSRPASSMGTRSSAGTPVSGSLAVPPVPPVPQQHLHPSPLAHEVPRPSSSPEVRYAEVPSAPPAYEEVPAASQVHPEDDYTEVDVLDIPAPRPASPFSAASSRPTFPPGLVPLPTPRVWRDSHASSSPSPGTDSTLHVGIDVLEDEPPSADNGWRSLAGGFRPSDGRRTTFGVPMVVHPRDALHSERGSLHSMRSHLSPNSSMSPAGSAPASTRHTMTGSGSSRPSDSSHSRGPTGSSGASLAHTNSISSEDRRRRRADVGEVMEPPISAVFPGRGFPSSPPPPAHTHGEDAMGYPPAYPSDAPTPMLMRSLPATVSGTMTSTGTRGTAGTDETMTDESVTTAQTDPITGAVMHFPRLPWRNTMGQNQAWSDGRVREDAPW